MAILDVQFPDRILFGIDAAQRIGEIARDFGERAVLITEVALRDDPAIGQILAILGRVGVNCLVYDELQTNAASDNIHSVMQLVRASKVQSVIGFGGMRALGIARTAAALANSKVTLDRFLAGVVPTEAPVPFISVPSTCRDHFFAQNRYILQDPSSKKGMVVQSQAHTLRAVILDPRIAMNVSPKYFSVVIMDVLLAAVEAYTSTQTSFLSDAHALKAVDCVGAAFAEMLHNPKDIRPRVKAAEACLLSGLALGTSSMGLGGAISFAINSRFNIPKSWAATALLPFILELHASHQPNRVAFVARALGEDTDTLSPEDAALRASRAVRKIIARLELPSRFRDFNLSLDTLPEITELAAELEYSRAVPFPVSHGLIADLIKQAF